MSVAWLALSSGCASPPPVDLPPPPPPPRAVELVPPAPGVLNAIDRQRGTVYRGAADTCWVIVPYPEPPTSVRDYLTEAVICPPFMLDPSWEPCRQGLVRRKDAGCTCFQHGDPPSEVPVACPRVGE